MTHWLLCLLILFLSVFLCYIVYGRLILLQKNTSTTVYSRNFKFVCLIACSLMFFSTIFSDSIKNM